MERFSVILFSLCSLALQTGSTPAELSTIETLWDSAHNVNDVENHQAVLLKSKNVQNSTRQFLIDEDPVKNTTEIEEYVKDHPSSLKAANASTTLISNFSSSYVKNTQHSKHNEDREDDAYHKEGPAGILSSHDILLDPSLIPARLSRQAEKNDVDYSNLASIKNISSDIEPNNHDESRNVVPLKRSSNFEDDLGVAEDRYPPPYPYWNPYYQRQFPNQRNRNPFYRINDRREPYHNYWRYPVFPGK